jgi:hypothetical protein
LKDKAPGAFVPSNHEGASHHAPLKNIALTPIDHHDELYLKIEKERFRLLSAEAARQEREPCSPAGNHQRAAP